MNNKIMKITAILIVILSLILIAMIFNYFFKSNNQINKPAIIKNSPKVSGDIKSPNASIESSSSGNKDSVSNSGNVISGDIKESTNTIENIIIPSQNEKEDKNIENNKSTNKNDKPIENIASQEVITNSSDEKTPAILDSYIEITDNTVQEPVISSSTETSNQEKQQVLNEIDNALQGLLEAVGKVPTVDEQKLNASLESEANHE